MKLQTPKEKKNKNEEKIKRQKNGNQKRSQIPIEAITQSTQCLQQIDLNNNKII